MRKLLTFCVFAAVSAVFHVSAVGAFAAVGCTLTEPDRDVHRIFPDATGYETEFITIKERGGAELTKKIEEQLADKLDVIYEAIDVPYAYYHIKKGREVIGYIHGVNQKGMFGGMQLILATDLEGTIVDFYYQKISSPEAKKFRARAFTGKFVGLALADFMAEESEKLKAVADPTVRSSADFQATLRGLKKNLILFDAFDVKKSVDKTSPKKDKGK